MRATLVHVEIAGPDASRLAAFYDELFGWSASPGPFPNYYALGSVSGDGVQGSIRQDPAERLLYVRVASLEATLKEVTRLGGHVLVPPTVVPGVVHFALFEDPDGNRMGLVQ